MTLEAMQEMFEAVFFLCVSIYLIGLGIGYVVKLIRSAVD